MDEQAGQLSRFETNGGRSERQGQGQGAYVMLQLVVLPWLPSQCVTLGRMLLVFRHSAQAANCSRLSWVPCVNFHLGAF